jgi:uncharacterized membrane protein
VDEREGSALVSAGAEGKAGGKEDPTRFRDRGKEITRLEGFCDAVFAVTLTLLVVSVSVPTGYSDLIKNVDGFLPFGFCFVLFFFIWHQHYRFSRRYGLEDQVTILLTGLLLFVVLFFAFPLKFLFTLSFSDISLGFDHLRTLYTIYGLGFAAVFVVFALLYANAYRLRATLGLNALESYDTRESIGANLVMAGVGFGSVALAQFPATIGAAGLFYFVIALTQTAYGFINGRRRRKLMQAAKAPPSSAPENTASS